MLIPLNSYEVSSSPIFVHALGFFLLLFGNLYPIILSLSFLLMSVASMIFFEKLIQHTHLNFKIILTTMFCGSGYFVAPMLNPTSDSPMILFLTLSLYAFCFSRRKLMSISLFCLVSVRQSLGWILVVFVVWDLALERGVRLDAGPSPVYRYTLRERGVEARGGPYRAMDRETRAKRSSRPTSRAPPA